MTGNPAIHWSWLTAHGAGALGVLRLEGAGASALVEGVFRGSGGARAREVRHGWLHDGDDAVDEALVFAPGPDEVEVSVHGGAAVREAVESLLSRAGARAKAEGGPPGSILAEARAALIGARTLAAAAFAAEALEGGLAGELKSIRRSLGTGDPRPLAGRLEALASRARAGISLFEGASVVLAGAPNAGKSTLWNALLGEDRAIVTPIPGTTRDLAPGFAEIGGRPFEIHDGAGLRATDDPVEREGIARVLGGFLAADLAVFVAAADEPWPGAVFASLPRRPDLVVVTKADLAPPAPALAEAELLARRPAVAVSARTGEGMGALRGWMSVLGPCAVLGAMDHQTPFTRRQESLLAEAIRALPASTAEARARIDELIGEEA